MQVLLGWEERKKKRGGSLVNLIGIFMLEWKHAAAFSAQEVLARSHGLLSFAICTLLAGLTVHHQKASFCLESDYDSPFHLFRRTNPQP